MSWKKLLESDRLPPHEIILYDRQEPLPQGRDTMVFLSAVRPRSIRDGPLRRRRRNGERLAYYDREAA